MVRTFTRTTFIENLEEANVELYIYENSKYSGNIGKEKEVKYTGLKSWSIIDGDDAEELNKAFEENGLEPDVMGEYLVLRFNDLTEATFRNSHVDMFIR